MTSCYIAHVLLTHCDIRTPEFELSRNKTSSSFLDYSQGRDIGGSSNKNVCK